MRGRTIPMTEHGNRRNHRRGHGEGSITQRSDGRWEGRLDCGWQNGRRRYRSVYGRTRRETAEKLNAALREHQDGLPSPSGRMTVGQFLTDWLENVARHAVRPSTFSSYETMIRRHIAPVLGRKVLKSLRPEDVQSMLAAMRTSGLSARTCQYVRAVLRRALGHALRLGHVARNVAALVEGPRVEREEIHPFTPEEVRQLLDGLLDDRLSALYVLAVSLGLRKGELLALKWADLDFERGTLSVQRIVQRIRGELVVADVKTQRSRRTVSLPSFVMDALRVHRGRQILERELAGRLWQGSDWVFTTELGGMVGTSTVNHHFGDTLRRLGMRHQRFHDLRHCCASLLLSEGLSLRDVMELRGHSAIAVTADVYGHLTAERRQEAARRMDALLGTSG
ncbi:MAG: tyrosine-type recombinase/integrase [Chloroflexi bacterium]|nr:tyrosine-type recombinase/integrase [Chloroflexota bacterium]